MPCRSGRRLSPLVSAEVLVRHRGGVALSTERSSGGTLGSSSPLEVSRFDVILFHSYVYCLIKISVFRSKVRCLAL